MDYRSPAGFDRTRNAVIGNKDFTLTYLEEAYTTEHWLVRIYRVKKPDEFNRPRIPFANRVVKSKFASKKVLISNLVHFFLELFISNFVFSEFKER